MAGTAPRAPRLPRRIAHCDLDTFFVAAERLRDPALVGRPVLVGGTGPRSVVASASYEARRFGCHSAQPMGQALRLCPEAVVVPPDFERYRTLSHDFHAVLRDVAPVAEPAGLDEAYADLTGLGLPGAESEGARAAAERLRARVRGELGLAVSVGIGGSKTVAKVASDRAKPDGLLDVPIGGDAAFLAPLPLRDLPLTGPKLVERLRVLGVRTVGDAAALDRGWLTRRFGRMGVLLADRARGVDPTPVHGEDRAPVSISREVTFAEDIADLALLRRTLTRHAERVGADLRRGGRRARTVTLKLRWSDFDTVTRSRTLPRAVHGNSALAAAGAALLDEALSEARGRPVRLLGLGVTNFVEDAVQLGFDDADERREERLDSALDAIRQRFGERAVARGATGTTPQ